MKYLVMECHPGYAVVMDENGRILRSANQNFQVGQTVEAIVVMQESKSFPTKRVLGQLAATAACLCLIALAAWQLMAPYGTVRMQINPDVRVTVNRLNYVIRLSPLNKDAKILLDGYDANFKKVDQVLDELTDRAAEMGFLAEGGDIQVTVESQHKNWQTATQDRLITELEIHTGGIVTVIPNTTPIPGDRDFDEDDDEGDNRYEKVKITLSEAKALLFSHLGITEAQVTDPEYHFDDGKYEMEFILGNIEYEYEVDAHTGQITLVETEALEPDDPDEDEEDDGDDDEDPEDDDEDDDDREK